LPFGYERQFFWLSGSWRAEWPSHIVHIAKVRSIEKRHVAVTIEPDTGGYFQYQDISDQARKSDAAIRLFTSQYTIQIKFQFETWTNVSYECFYR
jgi:hypothetical protein